MPEEDAELAELRRRVYGRQADLDGDPAAHARLAELEAARRPDPEPPDPEPHGDHDGAGLREAGTDDSGGASSEREPTISPDRRLAGDAPWTDPSPSDAPRDEGAPAEHHPASRRWVVPALLAMSVVAAVFIMLIAGGFGWSGGYLAGWAGAARPVDDRMNLEDTLQQQDLPDDVRDEWGQMLIDPATGELADGRAYLGTFGDGAHVMLTAPAWTLTTEQPSDRACLQVIEVVIEDNGSQSTRGNGACGSKRLGIIADVVVSDHRPRGFGGLSVPGYALGTVLRFVYDDATETVSVWSLPPDEETDPTA